MFVHGVDRTVCLDSSSSKGNLMNGGLTCITALWKILKKQHDVVQPHIRHVLDDVVRLDLNSCRANVCSPV